MMHEAKEVPLEIVVVDDSDYARAAIVEILEGGGHKVMAQASSAKMAVQIAESQKVNLFIIDVVMPEESGIEACQKILERNPQIAVILISSLNAESVIIDSIVAGAIDFLKKPFSKEELLKSCLRAKKILSKRN